MSRTVTLVIVDRDGTAKGVLPPFTVDLPYWPEVADVVAGARERFGVEVTVLRLLAAERPLPHGGAVTYLAEADLVPDRYAAKPAEHTAGTRAVAATDPHRAAYAQPGGPAASLRWATAALESMGRGPVLGRTQQRTGTSPRSGGWTPRPVRSG